MGNEINDLNLRIERIEKMIEGLAGDRASKVSQLTPEEIAAFKKVRDVVSADWGNFCGINDCFRCIVTPCVTSCIRLCDILCQPCDVECSCGPCNMGGLRGRVGRFGGLG